MADPNSRLKIALKLAIFSVFRPFWSGNSNTPDKSENLLPKNVGEIVLVDVLSRTLGHFLIKSVRGYHFLK